MVKRRFLTHFKPWLAAVVKAGALIMMYQVMDQTRRHFRYEPFDISDVLKASTIAILMLAIFCGLRAWIEWCWFKLRRLRSFRREINQTFSGIPNGRAERSAPLTRRMV